MTKTGKTKHFVRSRDKNAVNAIFRTRDANRPILGGIYNAGNDCRSKEKREASYAVDGDIKSVTAHSVNDIKQNS